MQRGGLAEELPVGDPRIQIFGKRCRLAEDELNEAVSGTDTFDFINLFGADVGLLESEDAGIIIIPAFQIVAAEQAGVLQVRITGTAGKGDVAAPLRKPDVLELVRLVEVGSMERLLEGRLSALSRWRTAAGTPMRTHHWPPWRRR